MRRPASGVVVEFDEERGLGTVRDQVGRELPFHCTAIADGSRRIAPGTTVSFLAAPGHLGRMEARGLVSVTAERPAEVGGDADRVSPPTGAATDEPVVRDDDTLTVYLGSGGAPSPPAGSL